MPVVIQAAFRVVVLALEAQRLGQFFAGAVGEFGEFAVAGVARCPDDFALVTGQFLRGAEVVVVVVERRGVLRAFAFEQGESEKGTNLFSP